jgi:flagellar hook assembly protein FlgD
VELTIHNLIGQPVRTLVHRNQSAGTYSVMWDGKNEAGKEVAGGIYLYRLKAADQVFTRKMIFLK